MSRKIIAYIVILLGVISAPAIWNSKWFQLTFFPEKYWTLKVESHNDMVRFYADQVRICQLEVLKIKKTIDIELMQSRITGMSDQDAVDRIKTRLSAQTDTCREFTELMQDEKHDLEVAKKMLQHVQGMYR